MSDHDSKVKILRVTMPIATVTMVNGRPILNHANLSNTLANLPNPLHNLTASQKSADLQGPLGR
ncbi:MAG: hypothetical protein ACR2IS_14330 [Nitrososphaeraceae archaeon]